MRIVCHRCGCPIDLPDHTPAGAPVVCPRCGSSGSYTAVARAVRAAPRRSNHAHLLVLALLIAFCLGSVMAIAAPWPMLLVSLLGLAAGVVVMAGVVGRTWRVRWPLGIGTALLAVVLIFISGIAISAEHEEQERQEAVIAAAARAEQQRIEALRAQSADRIARARQHLAGGDQAVTDLNPEPMTLAAQEIAPLAELNPLPDGYSEVARQVRDLNARLARTGAERHLGQATVHAGAGEWAEARSELAAASPYVAALGADASELQQRQAALQQRGAPFWAAISALEQAQAALDADHSDAIAAESAYDSALAVLDGIEGEALASNGGRIRSVRRRLESARRRNHRAAERLGRDRAARAAQLQRCGARPSLSPWDGELIGSESYMQRIANDPDSIDVEQCTSPSLAVSTQHCWLSTCSVLGRNGFGAMIRNRMQFEVRGGQVVSATRL